jgi:hypothetical protein
MLRHGHRFVPKKRGEGLVRNGFMEKSGKSLESAGGKAIPKQYPWQDKAITVQESRKLMKNAHRYTDEDRANLFEHIGRLHPQILLNRRRA